MAYATATHANPEAEKVCQMVLANQFISGLRPELQAKLVRMEGTMDALVLKARFEEAKAREFAGAKMPVLKRSSMANVATSPSPTQSQAEAPSPTTTSTTASPLKDDNRRTGLRKCFNCGLEGVPAHIQGIQEESRRLMESHV